MSTDHERKREYITCKRGKRSTSTARKQELEQNVTTGEVRMLKYTFYYGAYSIPAGSCLEEA